MDASVVDVRTAVTSIIHDFAEASELFQKWRKGRAGKRATAQEECKNSLEKEQSAIQETFDRLSLRHGTKFDRGDRECLDSLIRIRTNFLESVVNVLTHAVVGKVTKTATADPLVLIRMSIAAGTDTVKTTEELSRRILSGTMGPYTTTDQGDVLPHMPLRPTGPIRPPRPYLYAPDVNSNQALFPNASANASRTSFRSPQASQTSFATTSFESVNSSLTSLESPFAPGPQRNNVYMPMTGWTAPEFGASQIMVRTRPSSSAAALSWMKEKFPVKPPRSYYDDIAPLKPTPAVVPTFTCDEDATDILEESRRAAAGFWESANEVENDGTRRHAHSAPILQEPWKEMFGFGKEEEEDEQESPPGSARASTPRLEEEDKSQVFLRPVLLSVRPSSAQGGRRIRSEPMIDFAMPALRSRRHVSGPK